MALTQPPQMTEKNLNAHRRNARKSRGATTPQGEERARAANLRHGYYSKINDRALKSLGEDPRALADLIAGAHEQWRPANAQQAWIAGRLARLQWKIDRSDRMQENAMAQAVQRVADRRAQRALHARLCYADAHGPLALISEATLRPDYYTPPGYFVSFAQSLKVNPAQRMNEILRLMHRLRRPRAFQLFTGSLPAGAMSHESWREARELFEDGSPIPQPAIPVAQGDEREDLRAELHDLVAAELEAVRVAYEDELLPEAERPLSQQERDELAASTYKSTELIRRQEHACFREFIRLGTLLAKLQAHDAEDEPAPVAEATAEMTQPDSEDPAGSEPSSAVQESGLAQDEHSSDVRESGQVDPDPSPAENAEPTAPAFPAPTTHKNEGASGDVDENKGEGAGQEAVMANPSAARTIISETTERGESTDNPGKADLPAAATAAMAA